MTMISPTEPTGPAAAIARAAALLEAVARDSEQAVDVDVPLRCGLAANRLHTVLGFTPVHLPFVGDNASAIAAVLDEAITLLSCLQPYDLTEPVLDALLEARTAASAVTGQAVR